MRVLLRLLMWLLGVSGALALITLYPLRKRAITGFVRDSSIPLEEVDEWQ